MIKPQDIKVRTTGTGYTVGEIIQPFPGLNYQQAGELVCLFDNIEAALNYIPTLEAKGAKSSADYQPGFNVFQSFDEAYETFTQRPESVVHYDETQLRIKDESESGNRVDYDVTGDFIDMGRYMEGIPESVGTMHAGNSRNRRVNLTIHANYSGGTGADIINHRSERIIRLVDALESGGVRCMVTYITSNECAHNEIIVKRHEEPLTITDIAVVTNPDFHRRMIFRTVENSKTYEYGYGSSNLFTEQTEPEMLEIDSLNDEMGIFIGNSMYRKDKIDKIFDKLERFLVWEMSKPVPEVTSIKAAGKGIYFNPNGSRDNDEIRREGQEVLDEQ